MQFSPTALAATLWYDVNARAGDEAFIVSFLKSGEVAIDVGANIGHLALNAAVAVGSAGHVLAIEASPITFRHLVRNITRNGFDHVAAINVALGDRDGTVVLSDERADDQNHVLVGGMPAGARTVPVVRLDALTSDLRDIALLKIDVEGYELMVLNGAEETLARTRAVYFESWEKHAMRYGYQSRDVLAKLMASGFGVYRRVGAEFLPVEHDHHARARQNLIAVRDVRDLHERLGLRVDADRRTPDGEGIAGR